MFSIKKMMIFVMLSLSLGVMSCEQNEVEKEGGVVVIPSENFPTPALPKIISFSTEGSKTSSTSQLLEFESELHFIDSKHFLDLVSEERRISWLNNLSSFQSKKKVYDDICDKVNLMLSNAEAQYGENPDASVTAKLKMDIEAFLIGYDHMSRYEDGKGLDILGFSNYHSLVNEYGLVKIGGKIYQWGHEYIKIINDGDFSKISKLDGLTSSDATLGIDVHKVSSQDGLSNGRIEALLGSCENVKGRYRLITYEGLDLSYNYQANRGRHSYLVKQRSLKKTAGIWFNYKTSAFRLYGSFIAPFSYNTQITYQMYPPSSTEHTSIFVISQGEHPYVSDQAFLNLFNITYSKHFSSAYNNTNCSCGVN